MGEKRPRLQALAASAAAVMLVLAVACAPKAPSVAPGAPRHPEFLFPAPPAGAASAATARLEAGWRFLQADDLRRAEGEFGRALKSQPGFVPATTGLAYVALARRDARAAVTGFDEALAGTPRYVPALVGKGQALLVLERDVEALAAFDAALAADPSLADVARRAELLRVRGLQENLGRAQAAAKAGRLDEARTAYESAIAASPDSAFLYRDLAEVERKAGQGDAALAHLRKSADLDGNDPRTHTLIGELLAERAEYDASIAAYERARAIEPAPAIDQAIATLRERAREARLPPQYGEIARLDQVRRGDVAALLGVRLDKLLGAVARQPVVITDTRGHWAQPYITLVGQTGAMEVFPNYTFQPAMGIRRGDLANTVSRVLGIVAAARPAAAAMWQGARVQVGDVPATHLSYPAVSVAVAAGVLPLEQGNFNLLRPVTGREAVEAVSRLAALAQP